MEEKKGRGPGRPFVKNDPRINRAGRRVGSRNKFSNSFIEAMLDDFEANKTDIIEKVRVEDPSTYIRVCTALLPARSEQEIEVVDNSGSEHTSEIDWTIITGGLDANTESEGRLQVGEPGKKVPDKSGSRKTG